MFVCALNFNGFDDVAVLLWTLKLWLLLMFFLFQVSFYVFGNLFVYYFAITQVKLKRATIPCIVVDTNMCYGINGVTY